MKGDRPDLLLHVGIHKTGTTALQQALAAARSGLAEQGISYPDTGPEMPLDSLRSSSAHHGVAHRLASMSTTERLQLALFRRKLERHANRARLTVLSSEAFHRHLPAGGKGKGRTWMQAHEAYMRDVRSYLASFRCTAFMVVRDPIDFIESIFKEAVTKTTARGVPDFPIFARRAVRYVDFAAHAACLRRTFDDIAIRRYEDLKAQGGIVTSVFREIGADMPQGCEERARKSVSNTAALWLHARMGSGSLLRRHARVLYAARDPDGLFSETSRTSLWSSPEVVSEYLLLHRDRFAAMGYGHVDDRPVRPAVWTSEQDDVATRAFEAWFRRNAHRVAGRIAVGRRHYHP